MGSTRDDNRFERDLTAESANKTAELRDAFQNTLEIFEKLDKATQVHSLHVASDFSALMADLRDAPKEAVPKALRPVQSMLEGWEWDFREVEIPHLLPSGDAGPGRPISAVGELSRAAALLHDCGKPQTTQYSDRFTAEESQAMRRHVLNGYHKAGLVPGIPQELRAAALLHHMDYPTREGDGYPEAAEVLRILSRGKPAYSLGGFKRALLIGNLLRPVDVYCAMTDRNRKFREPKTPQAAVAVIESEVLPHLHPDVAAWMQPWLADRHLGAVS